jgi:hypothetical protein
MKNAIALLALSLALEAGFLLQIAVHAPQAAAPAAAQQGVARAAAPRATRG